MTRHVEQHGGQAVTGWMAWADQQSRYLYFVAHAVWRSPAGDLVDLTPQPDGEGTVLFAPDPRVVFGSKPLPGLYVPLRDDPEAHEYCRRLQAIHLKSLDVLNALLYCSGRHETGPRSNPRERAERRRRERKQKKKR